MVLIRSWVYKDPQRRYANSYVKNLIANSGTESIMLMVWGQMIEITNKLFKFVCRTFFLGPCLKTLHNNNKLYPSQPQVKYYFIYLWLYFEIFLNQNRKVQLNPIFLKKNRVYSNLKLISLKMVHKILFFISLKENLLYDRINIFFF